jgi:hypothetical protein
MLSSLHVLTQITRAWMALLLLGLSALAYTEGPQLPTVQSCNKTQVKGQGKAFLPARADLPAGLSGAFAFTISSITCDPANGYATGNILISLDLTDSVSGTVTSTVLDQVTTVGKNTPTAYLSGRCTASPTPIPGCRFWVMVADNKQAQGQASADIISLVLFDGAGKRVAHATGAVRDGDFTVAPEN